MAAQTNIPVICYDMQAVSRFFRSCALAIAIQHTTRSEWQTYRDSKVLNAVYKVLFWKEPPGLVEVRTGAHADIERRTDELHEKFLLAFIRRLAEQGPASAHRHIEEIAGLRTYAREAVRDVFAQAASINSEVIGTTQRAITDLARIKLGAQVGVAVLGSVAGIAFVSAAASGATAGAGLTILGIEAGTTGTGFAVAGAGHSITAEMAAIVPRTVGLGAADLRHRARRRRRDARWLGGPGRRRRHGRALHGPQRRRSRRRDAAGGRCRPGSADDRGRERRPRGSPRPRGLPARSGRPRRTRGCRRPGPDPCRRRAGRG